MKRLFAICAVLMCSQLAASAQTQWYAYINTSRGECAAGQSGSPGYRQIGGPYRDRWGACRAIRNNADDPPVYQMCVGLSVRNCN